MRLQLFADEDETDGTKCFRFLRNPTANNSHAANSLRCSTPARREGEMR